MLSNFLCKILVKAGGEDFSKVLNFGKAQIFTGAA